MGFLGGIAMSVSEYFRERAVIYAVVLALLAAGFGVGVAGARSLDAEVREELSGFLSAYVRQAVAGGLGAAPAAAPGAWSELLRGAFLPWLLGLSVIGSPLALAVVFLRGFAVGFAVRFFYEEFSFRGALLGLASIVPHSVFTLFGVCLAAGASLTFAAGAAKLLFGRAVGESVYSLLAAATFLCAVAALSIVVGAWVQGNVTPILAGLAARWLAL